MDGLILAFAAAVLFGVSIPASKLLLHDFDPLQLAGLLYLGAFASAPFVGAALSLAVFGEPVTGLQALAAVLFLISVVLLVTGRHEHPHHHVAVEHIHAHTHDDDHHLHGHPEPVATAHAHWHRHDPVVHTHPHWPDLHHRHSH